LTFLGENDSVQAENLLQKLSQDHFTVEWHIRLALYRNRAGCHLKRRVAIRHGFGRYLSKRHYMRPCCTLTHFHPSSWMESLACSWWMLCSWPRALKTVRGKRRNDAGVYSPWQGWLKLDDLRTFYTHREYFAH
jgi:hypothetical protein